MNRSKLKAYATKARREFIRAVTGRAAYYGLTEGVARAFIADMVAEERRGTAYGLYHGTVGISLFASSLIAGWLWDVASPAAPFFLGAGIAGVATLALVALIHRP